MATALWAAKANTRLRTMLQPDGTTIDYRIYGDEDCHFLATPDGALLVREGNCLYVASVEADGTLTATTQTAHNAAERDEVERRLVESQDRVTFIRLTQNAARQKRATRSEQMDDDSTLFPHSGSPKAVVLLIGFTDTDFTLEDPYNLFDRYLNAEDYFDSEDSDMGTPLTGYEEYRNYGSVRKYFEDMSFGAFTPQFDLYGPYTIDYETSKFAGTTNMSLLIRTACSAADDDIDFTDYDENGDGYVDLVYIIYAGYAQSITGVTTDIWPNSGTISTSDTFDGMKLRRYGVNSELNFDSTYPASINGIGLFCHEFSHCLGLPDLYPSSSGTTEADNYFDSNLEYWSLMDAGEYTLEGYRPTAYTAWERERMGWLDIEELTEATTLEIEPLNEEGSSQQTGKAYRIRNDENEDEYYILENIQQRGWNQYVYGHGMTVMHVDYDDDWFQMLDMPNSEAGHPRMALIAADNLFIPVTYVDEVITEDVAQYSQTAIDKYLGDTITYDVFFNEFEGDPYPGTEGNTSLTDETTPQAWVYTDAGVMGKPLTNIAESDEGTITVDFLKTEDTGITDITITEEADDDIYSIGGTYMGNDWNALRNGVYISGGKKKIVKHL